LFRDIVTGESSWSEWVNVPEFKENFLS
jgi:hypothetical protein